MQTKRAWFIEWKEANQNEWWMRSDGWNACQVYHANLADDAVNAGFPVKKDSDGRLSESELNLFYGIRG